MDIELARVVAEDLDFLFNEWNQDIDDASLRRASPILRLLLIDGQLSKIAHQAGREIRILAPAICSVYSEAELKTKKYYQAGGAKYKGIKVQFMSIENRASTPDEIKTNYDCTKNVIGKNYPVKLSVFMKQASFSIGGMLISREDVIKYVTHKLGGAHYDSSRSTSPAGPKGGPSLEDKYRLLDTVRTELRVADKNAIYYELLSIGQRIVNSRDVRQLRKHLQQIVSQPSVIYA